VSGGLDPLGMLAPIESLYARLLTGISSVTVNIRYYAFYVWWIRMFVERDLEQKQSQFDRHIREGEILLAAASLHRADEYGQIVGLGGSTKVKEVLDSGNVLVLADLLNKYLKTPVYRAAYGSQLGAMGLTKIGRNHRERVPTALGNELADAFEREIGQVAAMHFMKCADAGMVTADDLETLLPFRATYAMVPESSEELRLMRRCLTGREGSGERRNTCIKVLKTLQSSSEWISDSDIRFVWLDEEPDPVDLAFAEHVAWQHYQISDLLRVGYECILNRVTSVLMDMGGADITARQISLLVVQDVTDELSLEDFILSIVDDRPPKEMQQDAINSRSENLMPSLKLLGHLWIEYGSKLSQIEETFPFRGQFRTVATEFDYFNQIRNQPARTALASLVLERIIWRHLDVASRKLRGQPNFTFQFEYDEGSLAARQFGNVGPSSPRAATLLAFMEQVGLIDETGLTSVGLAELVANK